MKKLQIVLALLLVAAVGIIGIQGIKAKYTTSVTVEGNVTFSADIAESISLYEHQVKRLADGSYELTEAVVGTVTDPATGQPSTKQGNEYFVMPGVDIPKDPQIAITGKSALDSYLYVEIEDSLLQSNASDDVKSTIQYELTNVWMKLEGVTGPKGTTSKPTSVYVYTEDGTTPKILDESFPDDTTIKIIKDDIITVGENYASTDFVLNIYAHMLQLPQNAATAPNAAEIFAAQFQAKKASLMFSAMSTRSTANASSVDDDSTTAESGDTVLVDENAEETPEYVTITIHYVVKDDETGADPNVFDDYVATLRTGTAFSSSVASPTYPGYAPYLVQSDNTTESATEVELDYAEGELKANVEITVKYLPVKVPYVARYYLQNVFDDLYTEDTTYFQRGEAETGSYPENQLNIEIPGFKPLYNEPDKVAADGSTEFLCRYNREYYLYMFDCNGGYGVDPIYARYGTPIAVPNPAKPGYTFEGWDTNNDGKITDADEVPDKIGVGNATFKAVWSKGLTSCMICYWIENADSADATNITNYSFAGSEIKTDAITEQSLKREAYKDSLANVLSGESVYFAYNGNLGTDVIVEGDGSTILNVYFTRKEYTLRFYYAFEKSDGTMYVASSTNSNTKEGCVWNTEYTPVFKTLGLYTSQSNDNYDQTYGGNSDIKGKYHWFDITAKYNADLSVIWPSAPFVVSENGTKFVSWRTNSNSGYAKKVAAANSQNFNVKGPVSSMSSDFILDPADTTKVHEMFGYWSSVPTEYTYKIYYSLLNGETADGNYNNVGYKLQKNQYSVFSTAGADEQSALSFLNVTYVGKDYNGTTINLYYSRNINKLQFMNEGTDVYETLNTPIWVQAGENIKNYATDAANAVTYPLNLEPGAYSFEGWYTAPGGNGTKIDFNTTTVTMPDANYAVYAYWKPVDYTVRFYNHYNDYLAYKNAKTPTAIATYDNITHGTYLKDYESYENQPPTASAADIGTADYRFIGWFYINEEGEKERFEIDSVPVKEELHLFAEWESDTKVPYTIRYVYLDDSNNEVEIAPATEGYSYSGFTKTFAAKCMEELYEGYQKGYYPQVSSHSILMTEEETPGNVFTFYYVKKDKVSYTVHYKKAVDGTDMAASVTETTTDAVRTEKFKMFSGYIPDAYYKRLVLSANDDENNIIFYYTEDNDHAYYAVKHMLEDGTDSNGNITYENEYATIAGIADLKDGNGNPNTVTEKPLTINGYKVSVEATTAKAGGAYTVDSATGEVTGTITEQGLEMYILYNKETYPYEIQFKEYGTGEELHVPYNGSGKFEESISVNLGNFVGWDTDEDGVPDAQDLRTIVYENIKYNLIGDSNRTFTIRSSTSDADKQTIICYYQAQQVQINYQAVCHEAIEGVSFGHVSIASERVRTVDNIGGAYPMLEPGYQFVGWYTDAECTVEVNEAWVDESNQTLKPQTLPDEEVTYYALFEPILSSLKIIKVGETVNKDETFLFRIQGTTGGASNIDLTVSITGPKSVIISNLPIGTYKVTELTDWSWRYAVEGSNKQTIAVAENSTAEVTFENTKNTKAWLGGEAIKENAFQAYNAP